MRRLAIRHEGWGESWCLGHLADDGRRLLFEYSPEALARGLELSPRHLRLQSQAHGPFPAHQHRLPGLFSDALPDGWGLLLMDRWFRQQGLAPTPLARLAFLGDRAMGALRFAPAESPPWPEDRGGLLPWAQEAQKILSGRANEALLALLSLGGSAQGARPKVLVQHDPATGQVGTAPEAPGAPWLVKFQAQGEHKEVCAIEALYAELARACGLPMPDSALFDLSPKLAAFGVARFDREAGLRVPVHSLAGLLHADFRLPSVDYLGFLRATRFLTQDQREVDAAFARACFNALFHNRDDHAKNFAYRLGQDGRWRLAPAYDLTFCEGPGGQHHSDYCGEAQAPTRAHLLRLAHEGGVAPREAEAILEAQLAVAGHLQDWGRDWPIRRASLKALVGRVEALRVALGR